MVHVMCLGCVEHKNLLINIWGCVRDELIENVNKLTGTQAHKFRING